MILPLKPEVIGPEDPLNARITRRAALEGPSMAPATGQLAGAKSTTGPQFQRLMSGFLRQKESMMAITMRQVADAVEALEKAGEAVTIRRVRERIGS
ncbi:hypothetical protein SAMN04488020_106122 [Palleronia marisminoris]|uniref:Uncharacterized protein n=1 Tax=Palleronia marisminoris TaxID=315423 RepID=A0A1Y5T3L2_9RHOB|nr:hypothetical protein [Palleronia marisminoris]SFH06804.1 hypothetical protein SAMN04488020_106122 [Palleronia marisminoris]SLN51553.1 hypothetical protein PAM7066_02355 [Palleronia marisminoris]